MKKLVIISLFFLVTISSNAQLKKQNVYFLKNSGKEVNNPDSADFSRVIREPDSGETYYDLFEFYNGGAKKTIGKVSSFTPRLIYEGIVVKYNQKGAKVSSISYKKGEMLGAAFYFFDNGKVKKQLEYLPKDKTKKTTSEESVMVFLADSLGTVLVRDGNGHAIESTSSKDDVFTEEGDYKDGYKEGVWTGMYQSGKSSYVESYALGTLVSGTNTAAGTKYEYNQLDVPPQFKGGIQQFYRYLGTSIIFPRDAVERGISGSVTVSFVIEKDGSIVDAKVEKSLTPSTDQEALRVVMRSPKWIARVYRGIPVRYRYNIPISFKVR